MDVRNTSSNIDRPICLLWFAMSKQKEKKIRTEHDY